jgi:HSP20 family protein
MSLSLPIRRTDSPRRVHPDRLEPLAELDRLNRQLAEFLGDWRRGSWPDLSDLVPNGFTPLADVEETEDAYLIEVELPGVKREDLDIEIADRRVSVRGERKENERVGILRRRERTVGRFHYEVTLPGAVEDDAVEAHLDDGVLTVQLPKPASERPRRIEITG